MKRILSNPVNFGKLILLIETPRRCGWRFCRLLRRAWGSSCSGSHPNSLVSGETTKVGGWKGAYPMPWPNQERGNAP